MHYDKVLILGKSTIIKPYLLQIILCKFTFDPFLMMLTSIESGMYSMYYAKFGG